MNWELISAIVFYSIAAVLIWIYRKKFQVMSKVFIVHKTKKGLNLMKKLAKYQIFWKIFSTIAIPVSIFFMIKVGALLFENLIGIVAGTAPAGVALAIPGVKIPGSPIFIPFWYGIISIAVLAVVHEFSHGIVAAMEGVRLKSTGFGFLAILPLAFVELDEKQMMKKSPLTRLRIAAAGSFGNLTLYVVLMLIIGFTLTPFITSLSINEGISITAVSEGQPAQLAGLKEGDLIVGINDQTVYDLEEFVGAMEQISPGESFILQTSERTYELEAAANPQNESKAHIGVFLEQSSQYSEEAQNKYGIFLKPINWFYHLLIWIANLNFLIGIMNFLPIWALDGSRIAYDMFGFVIKKEKILAFILNAIFAFYATLIILNIIGPYLFPLIL